MYIKHIVEVIPEEDVNDPDSAFSISVRRMRKLLQSYEEKVNVSVPNYDDVQGKALLLAMGISIGDQVVINEEKVTCNYDFLLIACVTPWATFWFLKC